MKIIAILAILFFSINAFAIEWEYKFEDALIEKQEKDGTKSYSVDMKVIDYYINRISINAKEYPPVFESKDEQTEVILKLNELIEIIEIVGINHQDSSDFLSRAAFANSMGHNVDIKGSADRAHLYFKKLLNLQPNNPQYNYFYGMFLSGTNKYHFDGIPFLEKALKLDQQDARYTLGLLYYQQGESEKGMNMLKQYSADNPSDEHVKKIIDAINAGKLKFNSN